MIYPFHSLRIMAEHPCFQGLWSQLPELLATTDWPDCAFWQEKFDAHPFFQTLSCPLRLFPEIKVGQRRKRNLAKSKREAGRPTLRRYESSIVEDHFIPLREQNLHDYFNSLVWLRFPGSKYALHERAYRSYLEGPPAVTGNLRNDLTDALTRFDEGGVVYYAAPDEDVLAARALLRNLDNEAKRAYFIPRREQFEIFGHGLMEVWNQGGRNLTASALVVESECGLSRDTLLAGSLQLMDEPRMRFGTMLLDSILEDRK